MPESTVDRLDRLRRLREDGLISDDAYLAACDQVTNGPNVPLPPGVPRLAPGEVERMEDLARRFEHGYISRNGFLAQWRANVSTGRQATAPAPAPWPPPLQTAEPGPDEAAAPPSPDARDVPASALPPPAPGDAAPADAQPSPAEAPASASPATPRAASEANDEIENLRGLLARGAISQDEYERAVARVPGGEAAPRESGDIPAVQGGPVSPPPPDAAFEAPLDQPPPSTLEWGGEPPPPAPPAVSPFAPGPGDSASPLHVPYPMRFDVDYPERLSRLTTLFRGILIIPLLFLAMILWPILYVVLPGGRIGTLCKRKFPLWLYDAGTGFMAWLARFGAYELLLTGRYPSFSAEADGPVHLEWTPPSPGQFSRWKGVLWRIALLVPHYLCLYGLNIALLVTTIIAWFAILFTGRYPRGLFGFNVGVMRWHFRVQGYLYQFSDEFPPFSLSADAGSGQKSSAIASGIAGGLLVSALTAVIVVAIVATSHPKETVHLAYADLQAGTTVPGVYFDRTDGGQAVLQIKKVYDPGEALTQILRPSNSERVVVFEWVVRNRSGTTLSVGDDIRLKARYEGDDGSTDRSFSPSIVVVEDQATPVRVRSESSVVLRAAFVVPADAAPLEVRFKGGFAGRGGVKYIFDE